MKKISPKPPSNWEHIKRFCESLTDDEDSLTREMVACIADKRSLWTMSVIAEYRRPMRFSRITENVAGISQKSLTKTLRGLERNGLITREVFAEVRDCYETLCSDPVHRWSTFRAADKPFRT